MCISCFFNLWVWPKSYLLTAKWVGKSDLRSVPEAGDCVSTLCFNRWNESRIISLDIWSHTTDVKAIFVICKALKSFCSVDKIKNSNILSLVLGIQMVTACCSTTLKQCPCNCTTCNPRMKTVTVITGAFGGKLYITFIEKEHLF